MDARQQANAAAALEASGWHWYRPDSDYSGNVKWLDRVPWTTAIVMIQRGQTAGWILAKDEERSDPRQLTLVPGDAA